MRNRKFTLPGDSRDERRIDPFRDDWRPGQSMLWSERGRIRKARLQELLQATERRYRDRFSQLLNNYDMVAGDENVHSFKGYAADKIAALARELSSKPAGARLPRHYRDAT